MRCWLLRPHFSPLLAVALSSFLLSSLPAQAGKKHKSSDKTKTTPAPAPGSDAAATDPARSPTPDSGSSKTAVHKMEIPLVPGHPAKGLAIPSFRDGRLEMNFLIGTAESIDATHIAMSDLTVQTYDEKGAPEMKIDLPTSIYNTSTSDLTTKKHVTIRREDFVLTGESMTFNTETKKGTLGGGVKMIIYNLENEVGENATANTPQKSQP